MIKRRPCSIVFIIYILFLYISEPRVLAKNDVPTIASGSLEVSWPLGGASKNKFDFEFTFRDTNSWKLAIKSKETTSDASARNEVALFNGDIYRLRQIPARLTRTNSLNLTTEFTGSIEPMTDRVPIDLENFSHVIWLAYTLCTGNEPITKIDKGYALGDEREGSFDLELQESLSSKGELKKVWRVRNPGLVFIIDGKTRPEDPPYDKGYTQAELECGEFTDINGQNLPKTITWKVFGPRRPGFSADDLESVLIVTFISETIKKPSTNVDFRPITTGPTIARDYRLKLASGASDSPYLTTNGWWSTNSESFRQLAARLRVEKKFPYGRLLGVFTFLIFSAVSITILIKLSNRQIKNRHE